MKSNMPLLTLLRDKAGTLLAKENLQTMVSLYLEGIKLHYGGFGFRGGGAGGGGARPRLGRAVDKVIADPIR